MSVKIGTSTKTEKVFFELLFEKNSIIEQFQEKLDEANEEITQLKTQLATANEVLTSELATAKEA